MILLRPLLELLRIAGVSLVLSLGQIWANKTRSVLTVIGIVIGVASVTAVISALSGLKSNVLTEFEALGTNRLFIYAWNAETQRRHRWDPNLVIKAKQTEGLLTHCPSVGAYALIGGYMSSASQGSYSISTLRVMGIQPSWHQIENRKILMGRPFTLVDERSARHVCLITEGVRDELRLDRDPTGQSIVLGGNQRYLVVGLVESRLESSMFGDGGRQQEIFVPFSTITQMGMNPWQVMAVSRSPELVQDAMAELRFFFRRTRGLKPQDEDNFKVESIEYYLQQFNTIAATVTAIAGGVVGISLLVGGVGIMNIMLVSVSERTREIGLRKSVGARPAAILLQFLVEAVTLCLVGGLIGLIVGQLMTWAMSMIPGAQLERAYIPGWAVVMSFGFSAAVGVFFGLFPAVKAARLDPIEALRHE